MMKKTKMAKGLSKVVWLLGLGSLVLFLTVGCGAEQDDPSTDRTVSRDFGSYTVPAGWVRSDKYSTEDKVFYLLAGHEDDKEPDNVSVEMGENRYGADEHEEFRMAILSQISAQLEGVDNVALTGYGSNTEAGDVYYAFTFTEDLGEGKQIITRHFYIIGEKKYVLVHLTNFSGSEDTDKAAEKIAESFVWAE